MIAFDAGVLSLLLYPNAPVPLDFRTGQPIDRAKERVEALVDGMTEEPDLIVLPTPSLCEALVPVADKMSEVIGRIEQQSCFKISPFDKRSAIELAFRTKKAIDAGDKKEGRACGWQKVKYDRQIVAISQAEGASVLYSMDEDIHAHGKLWGLRVLHVSDLPIPTPQGTQESIFQNE
jgi:hypothetical protein